MTTRCFIIGHPVAQSRSPLIHGAWIAEHGLDGTYERVDVAPDALPAFLERLRAGAFAGGNVTVPHKQAVLGLVDAVGPAARAIGAANLLWQQDGRLHADNTDALGFLGQLDASVPGWADAATTALVLGAGGAARAVCYGLTTRGIGRIILVNRGLARAQALAADFAELEVRPWDEAASLLAKADLLVNTTSLGMAGQPPLALDLSALRPGTIVDDIVYVPLKTALLEAAQVRGARIVDGLGMLLHQAAPSFQRWFGVTPQVTPTLRDRLVADILGA